MKAYHYVEKDGLTISHTVQANNPQHAAIKFEAFFGINPDRLQIVSHADWKADNDLILEQTGNAPWQKALNRQERKNQFPLS